MRQRKVVWVRSSHEKVMLLREKSQCSCLQSQEGKRCERSSSKASPSRPRWAKEKKKKQHTNIQTDEYLTSDGYTMHKTSEGTIRSLILHFSRTVETCTNNSETPAAIMATYLMSASRQHSGTENVISCLEELLNHPNGEFKSQRGPSIWWGWYKWSKGAATGEQGRFKKWDWQRRWSNGRKGQRSNKNRMKDKEKRAGMRKRVGSSIKTEASTRMFGYEFMSWGNMSAW